VFASNSAHRARVTPAKRGKGNKARTVDAKDGPTLVERRAAMTWTQRLKRVFNIDIETCNSCGGPVKIIACIKDPVVVERILRYLERKAACGATRRLPPVGRRPRPVCSANPLNHASSRCDIEAAAGSLSSRAWKRSKYRAEIQTLCRPSGAIWANTASKRRLTTPTWSSDTRCHGGKGR